MKARVLNTFSISKCSEKIDVPNTFRTITMWKHCFEHFFHFKMFWQKWCSKHSCYNFHMKIHVLNIFSISRCSERNDVPNTLGAISLWLTFWTLFLFQDVLKEVMFQTLLEQFPHENSRFEHLFHFKMFWKKWCSKHSWINFHVKENPPFEHFFYLKMFCKKWCSKHSWNNFPGKTHLLNTFSISRCFERSDVPSTPGTISTWKITFWTFFSFQDVLKEVMSQTPLEPFQYEKSSFEHLFHFKMFWKKWCSKRLWNNFNIPFQDVLKEVMFKTLLEQFPNENSCFDFLFISRYSERSDIEKTLLEQFPNENSRFEFFFHFKMSWKKWCSKHSWNNFHMKTHVLNTFSISRCSERSDVPNTFGTISTWKLSFWTLFFISRCSERSDVQNPLGTISKWKLTFWIFFHFKMFWKKWCSKHSWKNFMWKLTFWTLFPFQDILKEMMFQTLLEQFPYENSRFEHIFPFKMFWKRWCSKHSWNKFHMKTHVLNTFSISRCSERNDVPHTFRTLTMWKPCFEQFFHVKMFWQKWCSKHSCYNFHVKTHVLHTFLISRCSERSSIPNTLRTISTWKLAFWTLFRFQNVLKKLMSQTLFEQLPCENTVLNTFSISRCSDRSDVPSALATIFTWKFTFWTFVSFQDVLKEVMFQTLLGQFPCDSPFEHFFYFKMFWKKWCSKHSWNNFHMKTHVLNICFISRCSERSDVPNTLELISMWKKTHLLNTFSISRCSARSDVPNTLEIISMGKLNFWTLFLFQDVLKEVMFQALLEQFPHEKSRFEHFFSFQDVLKEVMSQTPLEPFQYEKSSFEHLFHFKMFWKKWCSKRLWNNFNLKNHVLNTFSISRCSERSDVPNAFGTISTWKFTFWTLFQFQDVLKEVMSQSLLEQFPRENSSFEHFFHFKMFWEKCCSKHSCTWKLTFWIFFISNVVKEVMFKTLLEQFPNENSRFDFLFISRCSERSDIEKTLLEQFPNENLRFEFFFHFKMSWKKWCSDHSWNNFHVKT